MSESAPRLVITAIHDPVVRAAALTWSHGNVFERLKKTEGASDFAGIDVVELTVPAPVYAEARRALELDKSAVAIYDVFPFPASLDPEVRTIAAQFLAAETIWTLAEDKKVAEAALDVRVPVPAGWDRDPRAIQEKLVELGALNLTEDAVRAFQALRARFDPRAAA